MSRADKKHPINIDDLYDLFEAPVDVDYSDIEEHTSLTAMQKHRALGMFAVALSGVAYFAAKNLDLGNLGALLGVEHLTEKAQTVGYSTSALFAAVAAAAGAKLLMHWGARHHEISFEAASLYETALAYDGGGAAGTSEPTVAAPLVEPSVAESVHTPVTAEIPPTSAPASGSVEWLNNLDFADFAARVPAAPSNGNGYISPRANGRAAAHKPTAARVPTVADGSAAGNVAGRASMVDFIANYDPFA